MLSRTFGKHARSRVCVVASFANQPVKILKNDTVRNAWFQLVRATLRLSYLVVTELSVLLPLPESMGSMLHHCILNVLISSVHRISQKLQRLNLLLYRDTSNSVLSWMGSLLPPEHRNPKLAGAAERPGAWLGCITKQGNFISVKFLFWGVWKRKHEWEWSCDTAATVLLHSFFRAD